MSGRALQRALRLIPAASEALSSRWCGAAWSTLPAGSGQPPSLSWQGRQYSALSDLLQKELSYEEDTAAEGQSDSALRNVPSGWQLSAEKDDTTLVLSKQHAGQQVSIKVSVLGQEEASEGAEDAEEQEGPDYAINFSLDCDKGSETLRFSLLYMENDTEGPEIEHVSVIPKGMKDDEEAEFYTGPTFGELDEAVQEQFGEYVAQCGVNAELCQYLCRLVYDKEQELYTAWLRKVAKLVQ